MKRAERTAGGPTTRCRKKHRKGIKRAQAVIREEFQPSNKRVDGGEAILVITHCKKTAIFQKLLFDMFDGHPVNAIN